MRERDWLERTEWEQVPALSLPEPWRHLVVAVAHPDDESLAAGGLIATAARAGVEVSVLVASDGEASHPDSPTHTPEQLRSIRQRECRAAVRRLAPAARLVQAGLPDGALGEHVEDIRALVQQLLEQADPRTTLVLSTWRRDGHPDHEAVALGAAQACAKRGIRLLEAPIWWWQWRDADGFPWHLLRVHRHDEMAGRAKSAALAEHQSQVQPLSQSSGDEAIVDAQMAEHFERAWESFVEEPAQVFDAMYADDDDPWRFEDSWYEARKRALTLAALPGPDLGRVLEIGPATGLLTVELAARASHLLAVDISTAALRRLARRVEAAPYADRVEVRLADVTRDWPEGVFDTIVISEVGYFMDRTDWLATVRRASESLSDQGALLLVHWRHAVQGWPLDGNAVHRLAHENSPLQRVTRLEEADFLLDVLRPMGLPSPAEAEGRT